MLIVRRNELNNLVVSVSLNKTIASPYYLFSFENITSKEKVRFYPKNISTSSDRYDEFQFNEGITDLTLDPPRIHFQYPGQYYYGIYEMVNSGTTNPQYAISKVGEGRALVLDEADPIPYPFVYQSSNEDNDNYVYYQEGVNDARLLISFNYRDSNSLASYSGFLAKYPRFKITNSLTNHSDYYRPELSDTTFCGYSSIAESDKFITEEIITGTSSNSIRIELDVEEALGLGYDFRFGNTTYSALTFSNFGQSIISSSYSGRVTQELVDGSTLTTNAIINKNYLTNPRQVSFGLVGNVQVEYGISDLFYTGNTISEVCDNINTGSTLRVYYTYPKEDAGSGISWFTPEGTGLTWNCSLTGCDEEQTPVNVSYIGRLSGTTKVIAEVINGGRDFIFDSICIPVTPTPTPTQTITPTPSITPTLTPTPSITPTLTPTSSPSVFNPTSISGLTNWWETTSGITTDVNGVVSWTDSISSNVATRNTTGFNNTTEVLNGYTGITQTSNNQLNLSSTLDLSATTIFVVIKQDGVPATGYVMGDGNGGLFMNFDNISIVNGIYNNPDVAAGGTEITTEQYFTYQMDATDYYVRQNGSQIATSSIVSGGNMTFTQLFKGNSFPLLGTIWEILVYNRALNGTEIGDVETYIQNKYGL